ncbi:MAG: hypothetical protein ACI87E_000854 [Mariniblastus sp.]|jgi:hypothetical protein
MKTLTLMFTCVVLVSAFANNADAQLRFKNPFGKDKPAAQERSENLTQGSGPWLIMCASFVGEDGHQQARRLTRELSEKYGLKSYLYERRFDHSEVVAKNTIESFSAVPIQEGDERRVARMKTAKGTTFDEIAVLVGDFPSVEDGRAQKILSAIKRLTPESMLDSGLASSNLDEHPADFQGLNMGGRLHEFAKTSDGPLRAAFMMPNPLLPDEYFNKPTLDEEVVKWNKKTKWSLLDNASLYTVKIATFGGDSTFKVDEMQQTQAEDNWRLKNKKGLTESKLANGIKKATVLCDHLRKQGVEAYVFYDRYESYVCVGGFEWLVQDDERGIKRNNPGMVKVIQEFKGAPTRVAGRQGQIQSYQLPMKLAKAGIACDMQPVPVLVPKEEKRTASRLFSLRR